MTTVHRNTESDEMATVARELMAIFDVATISGAFIGPVHRYSASGSTWRTTRTQAT